MFHSLLITRRGAAKQNTNLFILTIRLQYHKSSDLTLCICVVILKRRHANVLQLFKNSKHQAARQKHPINALES
jgi:hypothetical protein